jgi:hemerythrin-like domain-containing protein
MNSIQIIRAEHRALAAVLQGLQWLTREVRREVTGRDFEVLAAMVYYIDAFPERFHHPKEDRWLFARLRERHPAAAGLLDALESEHAAGAQKIRDLALALTRFRAGGQAEYDSFAAAVEDYVEFEYAHIGREEREVLPLATAHLTSADWPEIDAAFAGHTDPLLGTEPGEHWSRLFSAIVARAPQPIGVGPSRAQSTAA